MVIAEFSIFPVDKGESLSPYVARCIRIVEGSGVRHELNPMGTVLEGEWDDLFQVIRSCFKELKKDCGRISVNIKVDYREGDKFRMEEKVRSVREQI
jgi:uncharacterized protein (TIGR00106 family)